VQTVNRQSARRRNTTARRLASDNEILIAFSMYYVSETTRSSSTETRALQPLEPSRLNESGAFCGITPSADAAQRSAFQRDALAFQRAYVERRNRSGLPTDTSNLFGNVPGTRSVSVRPDLASSTRTTYNIATRSRKSGASFNEVRRRYYKERTSTCSWRSAADLRIQQLWDFANDAPLQETGHFNPITGSPRARKYIRSNIYAGFIRGCFKVRPNFTVTRIALEYFGPSARKMETSAIQFSELRQSAHRSRIETAAISTTPARTLGPQIGFAWSPGKLPF